MTKNNKHEPSISLSDYLNEELKDNDFANSWKEVVEEENIAQAIKKARIKAGFSQKQLAELLNTTQSFISDLENADYESYSLPTLRKIAKVLNLKLTVRFDPMAS